MPPPMTRTSADDLKRCSLGQDGSGWGHYQPPRSPRTVISDKTPCTSLCAVSNSTRVTDAMIRCLRKPAHGTGRTGARSMSDSSATLAMTLAPGPGDDPEASEESALALALDAALAAAVLASGSRAVVGITLGQRPDQIRHVSPVDRDLVEALCRQGAGASDGANGSGEDGRTAGWITFRYGIGQGSSAFVAVAADGLDELSTARLD